MTGETSLGAHIFRAVVILAIFAVLFYPLPDAISAYKAGAFLKQFGIPHYTNLFLYTAVGIIITILAVMALRRAGPVTALGELGLGRPFLLPVLVGLIAVAAMAAVAYAMGHRYQPQDTTALIALGVASPIGEEILFRGFVFRQLRRWAEAPFWLAALIASLVFAAGHWDQGDTLVSSLEASGVTFVGGFLFCWAAERWNSIWIGIILHMGLNIVWQVLVLGDNAIGDTTANVARLAAIVVTIAWTRRSTPGYRAAPA